MKTAASRLVVTLLSLLTAIVALATAVVRLVVTLVSTIDSRIANAKSAKEPAGQSPKELFQGPALTPQAPAARPNLKVVTARSTAAERLSMALRSLGFRAPEVDRFVAHVGPRADVERIEDLIKEGLACLTRAA